MAQGRTRGRRGRYYLPTSSWVDCPRDEVKPTSLTTSLKPPHNTVHNGRHVRRSGVAHSTGGGGQTGDMNGRQPTSFCGAARDKVGAAEYVYVYVLFYGLGLPSSLEDASLCTSRIWWHDVCPPPTVDVGPAAWRRTRSSSFRSWGVLCTSEKPSLIVRATWQK
jgi:hypothetical protein